MSSPVVSVLFSLAMVQAVDSKTQTGESAIQKVKMEQAGFELTLSPLSARKTI